MEKNTEVLVATALSIKDATAAFSKFGAAVAAMDLRAAAMDLRTVSGMGRTAVEETP